MIAQLLTLLQEGERLGAAIVKGAEAAHDAAVANGAMTAQQAAALDPGRHQVALGAIRTAIAHLETIMGDAADQEEAQGEPDAASAQPQSADKPS